MALLLIGQDRRCQTVEEGRLVCDRPTRSLLFLDAEKDGSSIGEIMVRLSGGTQNLILNLNSMGPVIQNAIVSQDADLPPCTTCPVYIRIKEDAYNKL